MTKQKKCWTKTFQFPSSPSLSTCAGARPLLGKGNNKNVDAFANYGFYNYTSRILSDYLL